MKAKNIFLKALRVAISVIFLQTLYFKFTAHPDSVALFTKLGIEPFGRIGVGIIELITSMLILIPKTKIYGAIMSFLIMMGAIFSHLAILGTDFQNDNGLLFGMAIVVLISSILLIYNYKSEFPFHITKVLTPKRQQVLSILFLTVSLYGCAQNAKSKTMNNAESVKTGQMNDGPAMKLTDEEWKKKLTPEQYYILREKGTEPAFSGEFYLTKEAGTYKCAACGEPLFTDDMKFESHCGWPSFDREIQGGKIIQTEDNSHGMRRTEITCANCGGHLGHIFEDGPTKTGKRYCVNSASLSFEPKKENATMPEMDTITLAGGCFWCIEAIYDELNGVQSAVSGYSGGKGGKPNYSQVSAGNTGYAEAVQIVYDPSVISMDDLLEVFFTLHDPTTLNRQGADVGTQYRSAVFYQNDMQKQAAEKAINTLNKNKAFERPIVTEVTQFTNFYPAENYHQEYYELNKEQPYCKAVILPKMEKLHKIFKDKIKKN